MVRPNPTGTAASMVPKVKNSEKFGKNVDNICLKGGWVNGRRRTEIMQEIVKKDDKNLNNLFLRVGGWKKADNRKQGIVKKDGENLDIFFKGLVDGWKKIRKGVGWGVEGMLYWDYK